MSRRTISKKRVPLADPKYNSRTIGRFINRMMHAGKKTVAEKVIYRALEMVAERTKKNPTEIFEQAIKNAGPMIEVRPRRVGGSTLQVPVDVPSDRRQALAVRHRHPGRQQEQDGHEQETRDQSARSDRLFGRQASQPHELSPPTVGSDELHQS